MTEQEFTNRIIKLIEKRDYCAIQLYMSATETILALEKLCKLQSKRMEKKQNEINIGDTVIIYTLDGQFIDKVIVEQGWRLNKECWKMHHNTVFKDDSRVSLPYSYNYKTFAINFSRLTGKQTGYNEKHYKHLPEGIPHKYYIIAEKWEVNKMEKR